MGFFNVLVELPAGTIQMSWATFKAEHLQASKQIEQYYRKFDRRVFVIGSMKLRLV